MGRRNAITALMRARLPSGRRPSSQARMRSCKSCRRAAAPRNTARPKSTLVMGRSSWQSDQPVADATHGLDQKRIGRIALDLAPQPIDLHIDRALADRAPIAGEREPRHCLARARGQYPYHLALAVGEAHRLLAAAQLAAGEMKHELPEPDVL